MKTSRKTKQVLCDELPYKYITVRPLDARGTRRRRDWQVVNNRSKSVLGFIVWYGRWQQYCFATTFGATMWSTDCLADLRDAIEKISED